MSGLGHLVEALLVAAERVCAGELGPQSCGLAGGGLDLGAEDRVQDAVVDRAPGSTFHAGREYAVAAPAPSIVGSSVPTS